MIEMFITAECRKLQKTYFKQMGEKTVSRIYFQYEKFL